VILQLCGSSPRRDEPAHESADAEQEPIRPEAKNVVMSEKELQSRASECRAGSLPQDRERDARFSNASRIKG
jgi:hypothetical protein